MTEPDGAGADDRALRSASAATWPAIVTERIGDWQLRSSRGFTGRANSALVVGDPGVPGADAAERVVAFYRRHGRAVLAQVVIGSSGDRLLRDLEWVEARRGEADCWVMSRPIDPADVGHDAGDVELAGLTDEWLQAKFPGGPPDGAVDVLAGGRSVFACVRAPDKAIVGVGRGSVAADHVGITALWVAQSQRRQGIGTRLLNGLVGWGRSEGAGKAFLEVLADNPNARNAYRNSGFVDRYAYRYLTEPHSGSLPLFVPSRNGDSTPS